MPPFYDRKFFRNEKKKKEVCSSRITITITITGRPMYSTPSRSKRSFTARALLTKPIEKESNYSHVTSKKERHPTVLFGGQSGGGVPNCFPH